MKLRTLPLLALFLLSLALGACGAPPTADEAVGQTQSALNGHSVPPNPPSSSFPSAPTGCLHFWNPMVSEWPQHGYCPWQPVSTNQSTWHVYSCFGAAPTVPGTIWLYSGPNFTGSCASIIGTGYPGYQWDSDLVQANGWLSIWTQAFTGAHMQVNVQSFRVAPSTNVLFCDGPFTGPGGAPCQSRMIGIGTQSQGVNYPSVFYSDGSSYTIAAIQLGTY